MKRSRKTWLIIIAVALLACLAALVWFVTRPNEPVALDTSQGPAFEVRVVVPWLARPFGGILPDALVKKFDGIPSELRFDHTNRGGQITSVGHDRVELRADGWDFLIESDRERRITSATHLVFPLALGGRQVRLNCWPADPATGYLRTKTRAGSNDFVGSFVVELANCKNAESGKAIDWPAAPLTVRGSFVGPPH